MGFLPLEQFVQTNVLFKEACETTFDIISGGTGRVNLPEATEAVEMLYEKINKPLFDLGIHAHKPSVAEVRKLFEAADTASSQTLDAAEFQDFYAKVVISAGVKAMQSATKRYGVGIAAGCAAVMLSKRLVSAIPVVSIVVSPLTRLVPTLIVGPILGIVAVNAAKHANFSGLRNRLTRRNGQDLVEA